MTVLATTMKALITMHVQQQLAVLVRRDGKPSPGETASVVLISR